MDGGGRDKSHNHAKVEGPVMRKRLEYMGYCRAGEQYDFSERLGG